MAPSQRTGPRLALLAFAQFLIALDYNIVYVALPDIGRALTFTPQTLQWVVTAYAVGFGGFLLLGGRAVDRLGARRLFVAGLLLFGAASLVGGFASGTATLVAARAVQGVGAALLSPATLSLINTSFAEGAARNRALAIWGACGSAGLAAGAVLGGVLTNVWGWRSVLFVMAPIALAAALLAPLVLAVDSRRQAGGFDVLGALLATTGSSLLVFGLVSGPEAGWASVRGAGAMVSGVTLLAAFLLVERRVRDPLAPLALLRNRSLLTAMLVILIFQSSLGRVLPLHQLSAGRARIRRIGRRTRIPATHVGLHDCLATTHRTADPPVGSTDDPVSRHGDQWHRTDPAGGRHVGTRIVLGSGARPGRLGNRCRHHLPGHVRRRRLRGQRR
ncbi:hypothetical protein GCM10009765_55500 [Fodinicola feengrottensis]|uniref:Major facilitator superfamily (MFS) profile domain-containing protein n=2 Tax=Fodinicola feengrottensis TaxID=435914 RepID=A0ABN2I5D0_9ACTN